MTENATNGTDGGEGGYTLAGYIVIGIILYVIVIVAIVGNVLVIASVLTFRKLRTVTNYFIVSLAIADLMVALLVMDFNAMFIVLGGYWPLGTVFCNTYIAIDILLCTSSILNLCIISLDRYWAITSPFTYYERVNAVNAIILIVVAWVVSFLISVLPVILDLHKNKELPPEVAEFVYNNPEFCLLVLGKWYAFVSSLVSFFIPSFIIIYTYARIFMVARRQARQISAYNNAGQRNQDKDKKMQGSMKKERKATKTLAIIVGVFISCWLPFFVLNIIDPFCAGCIPPTLFDICVWLGYVNSALNPIIYAQNKTFRNAFKTILFCYKCRGKDMRQVDSSDDHTAMSNHSRGERQRPRQDNGYNPSPRPSHSDPRGGNPVDHSPNRIKDTSLVIQNKNADNSNNPTEDQTKGNPTISVATVSDTNGNAVNAPL